MSEIIGNRRYCSTTCCWHVVHAFMCSPLCVSPNQLFSLFFLVLPVSVVLLVTRLKHPLQEQSDWTRKRIEGYPHMFIADLASLAKPSYFVHIWQWGWSSSTPQWLCVCLCLSSELLMSVNVEACSWLAITKNVFTRSYLMHWMFKKLYHMFWTFFLLEPCQIWFFF